MRPFLTFIAAMFLFSCASAQKSNPKAAAKYFDQALVEYRKGNPKKALGLLKKSLKADQKYANAWALQAEIAENTGDTALATASYKGSIRADEFYQPGYYYYAQYLFKQRRYQQAADQLRLFNETPGRTGFKKSDAASESMVKKAAKLEESCKLAMDDAQVLQDLDIRNLGPGVNSKNNEYWPGMTVDGTTLIFTRLVDMQEDFYLSTRSTTEWGSASPLPGKINTANNEGTTSVSANGRYIFFTVCNQEGMGSCDIFYSLASGPYWSQKFNLGETVNSRYWDAQPSISADGRTLIFSSARPGGSGGKDLWMTRWMDGQWSVPANLGTNINTDGDEEAPFLHYDGKTLYFSSNGHPGYGEQDMFISRLQPDGTWSKPENLGKGINSDADEAGLYVDFKGEKAYFASSRSGGFGGLDIYSFKLGLDKKPGQVTYVQGQVFDAETGKEISGRIEIINLESGKRFFTDSASYFFTTMEPNGNYALNVYRQGYLFYSDNFQPTPSSVDSPFVVKALLKPIRKDESIVLKNIFFDTDKFDLKPESYPELDQLAALLKRNPGISVEISGHTDNQGSAEHNEKLSQNRANSVKQYLTGAGISENRIVTRGYGAGRPVGDNTTAEGRALNRRIEMKVTGI